MSHEEVSHAYATYGHLVLRRCHRIMRHEALAEDALQEVFVRLWRYGEAFRSAESKVAWLYRVADRCCFDLIARDRKRREVAFEDVHEPRHERTEPSVADAEIVMRFLALFEDRVKSVAVHHYLDGMTQEEIAAATGWSRQTVVKKLALVADKAASWRGAALPGGRKETP